MKNNNSGRWVVNWKSVLGWIPLSVFCSILEYFSIFLHFISSPLLNLIWKYMPLCLCCLFLLFLCLFLQLHKYVSYLTSVKPFVRHHAAPTANVFIKPGEQNNLQAWDLRVLACLTLVTVAKTCFKYRFIKGNIFLCDWRIAKTTPFNMRETFGMVANAAKCNRYFRMYFQGKNAKGSYKDNRKLNKNLYWLTKGKWEIRPCPLRVFWAEK